MRNCVRPVILKPRDLTDTLKSGVAGGGAGRRRSVDERGEGWHRGSGRAWWIISNGAKSLRRHVHTGSVWNAHFCSAE